MSYDPHDGAVAERFGAQIQESRTLTLKLWLLKLGCCHLYCQIKKLTWSHPEDPG